MEVADARRLSTALRSGLRGVRVAPLVFGLSVGTMSAGLLLLASYLLVLHNMRSVLDHVSEGLRVVAYLAPGATRDAEAAGALRASLEALAGVEAVAYVSPEAAMTDLRRQLGDDADVLEGLPGNPLPAAYELSIAPELRSPAALRDLARRVSALPDVQDVRYGEDWVEGFTRVLSLLEWIGLTLAAFLVLVLGAVVGGTIRLAVYARSDEIQIQRLVGAGSLFVRLPFYLEGALQGALAAGLALGALYALFRVGLPLLREPIEFLLGRAELVFFGPLELAGVFALSIALGVGGAVLSLVRIEEST